MGDTDLETMANVTIAEYDYEDEAFDNVSDIAKDFIDSLLVKTKEWVPDVPTSLLKVEKSRESLFTVNILF